jgi:chromosome segregation ATPase
MQQRVAEESSVNSKDYDILLDKNQILEQQIEELKASIGTQIEARTRAEQAKKHASDQLYTLRQEAEIQREDLYSAELETKKAWKIVADANAKAASQAKELKELEQSKAELSAKVTSLQRSLDEVTASTKFGNVEKTRMETEISTLQRRVKMEQELTRQAEAELATKNRELNDTKRQAQESSQAKVAVMVEQKQKMENALKDWQAKHADVASRLDASETQRSRAYLEIEDLVLLLVSNPLILES